MFVEVAPGFEPGIRVLQTRALPLGYATIMAGVEGFEPPDGGIRIHCLTTWRYPSVDIAFYLVFGVGGEIRTLVYWSHNPGS